MKKKIGIVVNQKKADATQVLKKLHEWFAARDVEVFDSTECSVEDLLKTASLIICLGGDGTMLAVASHMKEKSTPVLGVNLGSLGFLTEVKEEEVFDELEAYLADRYNIENRLMLSCSAQKNKGGDPRQFVALNDIVVSREGLTRLLKVEVNVDGEKLTCFSGDGMIVATPTGSTAYSLAAGGAIVHPNLQSIIMTPICPHTSALRPIVVDGNKTISIKIKTDRSGDKALLTADGQTNMEIDEGYTINITKSKVLFQLVKSSKRSYFATLAENFKFPV